MAGLRWKTVLTGAALVAGVAVAAPVASAGTAGGLVSNGGFESLASGTPVGWSADSWGTNDAVESVTNQAHSGSVAVRTTITHYTDGDAKWMPDAVGVAPGSSYSYSDWYTADRSTALWAAFTLADGTTRYVYLLTVPAAAGWTPAAVDITAPPGAASLRVFHVLSGVGSLTIDDVGLMADAVCAAGVAGALTNGGFEDQCGNGSGLPNGWTPTTPASSTATYADSANAQQGSHAEQVGNGTDGQEVGVDAVVSAPAANQRYQLSFWQSGNTYVYAYVAFGHSDGTTSYLGLMSVSASGGVWSHYTDEFVTPSDVTAVTITIATSGIGTVTLDSVALTQLANQVPASFRSGMVSLTFDDGAASAYRTALPNLMTYGYRGTFYLNGATLNTPGYLSTSEVRALVSAGDEIGSHLYHHTNIVQLDDATLRSELTGNVTWLRKIAGPSVPVTAFASPYGAYTSGDIDTVMQYATSHRTTDGLLNTKANLDPRQIHARLVTPATSVSDLTAMLQNAKANHSWLVLVYHDIVGAGVPSPAGEAGYTVTPAAFRNQLAAIRASGLTVAPVSSALATLRSQ